MNYIKQLEEHSDSLWREVTALRAGLHDLRAYLHSDKFRCGDRLDHYVNVADVLAYIRNTEEAGTLARENP